MYSRNLHSSSFSNKEQLTLITAKGLDYYIAAHGH